MSWEMVEKFITEYREAWEHAANTMSALQSTLRELSSEAERKQREQCLLSPLMRRVTLDFEINEKQVTFEDYKAVMGPILHKGIHADSHGFVRGVTWFEANGYAQLVGKRLPTEQEWLSAGLICVDLWEWTSTEVGGRKVVRGGSISSVSLGTTYQCAYSPSERFNCSSFRCARDVK